METGRYKIDSSRPIPVVVKALMGRGRHSLRIFKATEAQNGQVAFTGIDAAAIYKPQHPARKKIEFIGNSITSGMGNDITKIPCDSGQWYDQHNAYFAYGPVLARTLGADFMLSSVSGIGIYRTWNMEQPGMPSVYESAYFHGDSALRWNFSAYRPDVVSICLGTNDLSDGDGQNPRKPFDSIVFVRNYVDFVGTIYKHYPNTQIALLTSPMISGEKDALFYRCLERVKSQVASLHEGKKPVQLFRFKPMVPKGCSYHPSKEDHEMMASQLRPFLERLLKD